MKVIGLYSVLKSREDPFRNWRNAATLINNEFLGKYFLITCFQRGLLMAGLSDIKFQ